MRHPSEADLALHAGGDLGWFRGWRVERHLAGCGECRAEVEIMAGVCEMVAGLGEVPEAGWARLAAEMKANIRLGLAAGECVAAGGGEVEEPWPLFRGTRPAMAMASLAVLLVAGCMLERPQPERIAAAPLGGSVVEQTAGGIRVEQGGGSLGLRNGGVTAREVTYSVGAQGSMRARYVDPDSGQVTINNVYAE